jgi:hypothetical protein
MSHGFNPLNPTGYFMCTTRFNVHKVYFLSTRYRYVFCMDPRTNGYYFSNSITGLGFITVTKCVYSAILAASFNYNSG